MKKPQEIFDLLKKEFPDNVLDINSEEPVAPVILVDPLKINKVCFYLRDNNELKFDSLMCLSGVDDANGEKIKNEDGTETIQGGTLSVYYHLDSIELKHKITLKSSSIIFVLA